MLFNDSQKVKRIKGGHFGKAFCCWRLGGGEGGEGPKQQTFGGRETSEVVVGKESVDVYFGPLQLELCHGPIPIRKAGGGGEVAPYTQCTT